MNEDPLFEKLKVKAADREYQVWERNSLSMDVYTQDFFIQKLIYIHNNPIQNKWKRLQYLKNMDIAVLCFMQPAKIDLVSWSIILINK
jgi:hypothetical protein